MVMVMWEGNVGIYLSCNILIYVYLIFYDLDLSTQLGFVIQLIFTESDSEK